MFVAGSVDTESAWWLDILHCESVMIAQDHDGLLEFVYVDTNEAVASSVRAAPDTRNR